LPLKLFFSFSLLFVLGAAAAARAGSPAAEPPAPAVEGPEGPLKPQFGVVLKASTLGVGGDVGMSITRLANVRVGFNGLNFSKTFSADGIHYDGTLQFRSAETLVDFTPLGDWFHVSPGLLFYNANKITATGTVPGGRNFDLGGVSFRSSPANPIHGTGRLTVNKTAPMVMFGFGNPIPHHHRFTIFHDFGIVFQGQPKTTLNLAGTACDPATGLACVNAATSPIVQTQVQAEQTKINKDTSIVKFYPVATLGIGIRF
jgi:hypothetical protein